MDFFQLEIMQVRAYAESRPTVPTHKHAVAGTI